MTTLEQTRTEQDRVAEKLKKVQQLYADAPEIGRVALKNGLEALKHELAAATGVESAGRIGARQALFATEKRGYRKLSASPRHSAPTASHPLSADDVRHSGIGNVPCTGLFGPLP